MTQRPSGRRRTHCADRRALTLVEAIVVLVVILALVALLLPAVRSARPAAFRNQCNNQLKQIALAQHNYLDAHGEFPPAFTEGGGRPLHSWRTLLLPYLEEQELYDRIDLSMPWDSEANAEAVRDQSFGPAYACPSLDLARIETTYLAVVGPDAAFPGASPRRLEDLVDGGAKTIGVVDADRDRAVPWPKPLDLSSDEAMSVRSAETQHPSLLLASFMDGHVEVIPTGIGDAELKAMLTVPAKAEPPASEPAPAE